MQSYITHFKSDQQSKLYFSFFQDYNYLYFYLVVSNNNKVKNPYNKYDKNY